MKEVGTTGIFLGYYIPWDGYQNAMYSQAHGFEMYPHFVDGSIGGYENLDNAQTGIHDLFKFLKYGFGRATDIACNAIRRGRMSREDAVTLVRKFDGQYTNGYLGYTFKEILERIGMTVAEFDTICDKFRNRKIFPDGKPLCSPCE